MATQREKLAGALFFIAVTQFVIGIFVAEGSYSGYSLSQNYVSDLGIGPSSAIFNSSVFVLGLLILFGTYFLKDAPELKTVNKLLLLMAISAMGVGIFNKNFTLAHGVVA